MLNFGEYSVKKVKTFMGHEGGGYNADLYRGKKKVATVIDQGDGGEPYIYWVDVEAKIVPITITNHKDEKCTFHGTPEQKLFKEHLETLPLQKEFDMELRVSDDWFLSALVEAYEEGEQLRKWCKKKTVLKLNGQGDGEYSVLPQPYDHNQKASWEKVMGDKLVEIINERFL